MHDGKGGKGGKGSIAAGAVIALVAVVLGLILLSMLGGDPSGSADSSGSTTSSSITSSSILSTADTSKHPPEASVTTTAAPTTTVAPTTAAAPGTPPPVTAAARALTWQSSLAALVVAPEGSRTNYDRRRFKHWIDADHDHCDTRCEVLASQRRSDLPGLARGGWLSLYDGYSTDDPSELDIDHVVPLAEAWESGASAWSDDRREAFANDFGGGQLLAVTAATNRSKSDRDPADWQPPNRSAWCFYAADWVQVKLKWGLSADQREVDALRNMLRGCP